MSRIEENPSQLLEIVNDLKKVGFTVVFESSEKGLVLKVRKKKAKEAKDFFLPLI